MSLKPAPSAKKSDKRLRRRVTLALYDFFPLILSSLIAYLIVDPAFFATPKLGEFCYHLFAYALFIYGFRFAFGVYRQIWRFGGTAAYLRLLLSDVSAGVAYWLIDEFVVPYGDVQFIQTAAFVCINLLMCLAMRMVYQYLYQYVSLNSSMTKILRFVYPLFRVATGLNLTQQNPETDTKDRRIKIAIIGAGRVGSKLAEELLTNPAAPYLPVCFIDADESKVGREIFGVQILSGEEATPVTLAKYGVQEVVFALPKLRDDRKRELYEYYRSIGCKVKVYDFPVAQTVETGRRSMREFQIEDLLFRTQEEFLNDKTVAYYRGKVILISGGGGSIGSEIARQIARMQPKKLIILDIYENGAYDLQQELKIQYGAALQLQVEIVSVTDRPHLERVFLLHKPDIVLHAAAHKHVPLMEHNCCEAVRNNVFGTLNMVEASEKFGVKKFIMISTDKAVNPTNVMGATKRMCEMIVQSRTGPTNFSATRFGNVLGSNGSVIPLFRRQIAAGGPVTLTDKRIIRYFMTIPEASQLVLTSGAMAKNGELYVLDMGKPIRIKDLAEKMIRLSGFEPYVDIDIVETGLRPGEKLYEELLIKTEDLDKTENALIFIERDKPLSKQDIIVKLAILREALATEDDSVIKHALMAVVPTFHNPEEVNANALATAEMAEAGSAAEPEAVDEPEESGKSLTLAEPTVAEMNPPTVDAAPTEDVNADAQERADEDETAQPEPQPEEAATDAEAVLSEEDEQP